MCSVSLRFLFLCFTVWEGVRCLLQPFYVCISKSVKVCSSGLRLFPYAPQSMGKMFSTFCRLLMYAHLREGRCVLPASDFLFVHFKGWEGVLCHLQAFYVCIV